MFLYNVHITNRSSDMYTCVFHLNTNVSFTILVNIISEYSDYII